VALDTKYRPLKYADVLGQDATAQMLKEIVRKGRGFHQSYVFGGGHGSGKTTLGRILARALLCENPQEGEPCDECKSCKAMLAGRSEVFIEIDAATNSGKDDVRRVTEDASFGSFSGKRKIYLWDESHELSRQAMDAMLKPMEDNVAGTENKQLVCIFCTTEPEKMRSAIMSRCAPAFRIRTNKPADIAKRLAYICDQEKITYESEALVLVSEFAETHIRDAIKAVEGVSMLGDVTKAAVEKYLNIAANQNYLEILEGIGRDLSGALSALDRALQDNSAATCYRRLADLAMMAYRLVVIGSADVPSYWDKDRVRTMGLPIGFLKGPIVPHAPCCSVMWRRCINFVRV
jgi:DNA polymerase-3 subunit gamma/tau